MTTIHGVAELNESKVLDVDGICRLQHPSVIVMDCLLYSFWFKNPHDVILNLQTQNSNMGSILKYRCAKLNSLLVPGIEGFFTLRICIYFVLL